MVYQNTFRMTKPARAMEGNFFIITMLKLQQKFIWHVHYVFCWWVLSRHSRHATNSCKELEFHFLTTQEQCKQVAEGFAF